MKEETHFYIAIIGFIMLIASSISSIFFQYSYFYVFFCLSFVLVLDYFDFKLRKKSLISFFMKKTHHSAVMFFIIAATIFAVFVDLVYGVILFKIWSWPSYTTINWIILYTLINFFFIMLVYETYMITRHFLSKMFIEKHYSKQKIVNKNHFKTTIILTSLIFLFLPLAYFFLFGEAHGGFVMIFPFLGLWLICDSILYLHNQTPIIQKLIQKDGTTIAGVLITMIFLVLTHEFVNKFSSEWVYNSIPFMQLQIGGVPIMVVVGWIPLVLFCISFLNLTKTLEKDVFKKHMK